ncbi:Casein kinase I isoform delta [Exophiala dermatitidis]|uniref:non-specific serine/threonine protein kinase n=1 Tax=Exophiala dermatitidis (strain ATCC 34100 / CBS 525.76 / NIH/UT8656) TaxID=858893 RepID=H6BKW0_EXODN|nr:casein kinase 1 [Exophiala dermatitidis NIH/UT8656]EHY52744.1 casein kinase 1 [Exophiala dermatitidis NIH/UT8656]
MDDPFIQRFLEIRLGGRYQICQRIGSGSFGKVYMGRDVPTGDVVAIKLEHCSIAPSLLRQEIEIYEELAGRPGIPRVFWHGYHGDFQAVVFELLGPNLEDLFRWCDNKFSLKTTLMLMDQLLHRVESLHAAGYLHRDIKPENFLLGTGKQGNIVYMTDFGLAAYRSDSPDRTLSHKPEASPQISLVGTCRYAGINGHLKVAPSRRDDLESLGYMALYFLHGSLPWQGLKASSRQGKYKLVFERKKTITIDELCQGLPAEFATYMSYIRGLSDHDQPDYKYLRTLFTRLFCRKGFEYDNVFDWTIREFERLSEVEQQRPESPANVVGRKIPQHRAGKRDRKRKRGTSLKE